MPDIDSIMHKAAQQSLLDMNDLFGKVHSIYFDPPYGIKYGSNFIVRQIFFCGGYKDEFKKWQKGLSNMAKLSTRSRAEKTLRIVIDGEAFDRLCGHISHPVRVKEKGHKVAVRVISRFGEESTKVIEL